MTRGAYSGSRWRQSRRAVLSRDNRRCQDCGSEEYLHIHHVIPVREFENPEDAHYPDNLVVLCKYCHPSWEDEDSRPRLADSDAELLVREVVEELETLSHRSAMFNHAPAQLYDVLIWNDAEICNNCHARMGLASHCSECGRSAGSLRSETFSTRDTMQRTHSLVDRLAEKQVPFCVNTLYGTIRALKSHSATTDDDRHISEVAVAAAVLADR